MKYSITQYAKLKNMSRQRVHQLIKNGKIPAEKIGNVWIIYTK